MEVNRTAPIPQLATDIITHVSSAMGVTAKTGEAVVVTWRNTIEMRHRMTRSPGEILIELDWAMMERVLMLGNLSWGMRGGRLWKQRVTGLLEQEILLAGARAAAMTDHLGTAWNMQAAYENFEFRDRLPHVIDVREQSMELSWYIIFATWRELGRPIIAEDWEATLEGVADMIPDIPVEAVLDKRLIGELSLDNAGINAVIRHAPGSVERSALAELVLYVTIEELHRKAGIVGASAAGFSWQYADARALAERRDHELRFNLLFSRCHNHADEIADREIARKVRAGAEVADRFQHFLELALGYGLPKLRECNWVEMRGYGFDEEIESDWIDDDRRDDIYRAILAYRDTSTERGGEDEG
jgi:hypothetical protein